MRTARVLQIFLGTVALLVGVGSVHPAATQDEDDSKAIKAERFIKERPLRKSANTARYKPVSKSADKIPETTPPMGTAFADLGVTFWLLRPSTTTDVTKELIEDEDGKVSEWTPERIEEGTPLATGQKVRLSIESLSRPGYLYVIDRAQYSDGTLGEPLLIFPTQKTANANRVRAGRVIYIPSATGKFTIMSSQGSKVHVGELVTILVSPQPLIDFAQLGVRALRLPSPQLEAWEKKWGATNTKYEMDGGAGQAMTEKEQAAGSDNAPELTQDDPVPQTIYRLAIKPENPVLVNVPLRFRK